MPEKNSLTSEPGFVMLGSIRFRVAAVHPFIRSLKSTTFCGRRFARRPIARIQQTVAMLLLLVRSALRSPPARLAGGVPHPPPSRQGPRPLHRQRPQRRWGRDPARPRCAARPVTATFRDDLPAGPAALGQTASISATREPNAEWVEIGRRKPRLNRSCAQRSLRSAPQWSSRKAQQSQPTRCRHR